MSLQLTHPVIERKDPAQKLSIIYLQTNGWFQKISIPIPWAASRNSEGEGGLHRLEFRGHGGVHWTGIPKAWGDFQESNFQFGVVKLLKRKLIKNDLSKDDDSLVNTRHIQLNQHARCMFQWSWSI